MLDLFSGILGSVVKVLSSLSPLEYMILIELFTLSGIILHTLLTGEPKRNIMDSHHYTMYRKLAGAAARPYNEVKHYTVCTAQDGSKVLMDLGRGRGLMIQQL